MQESKVKKQTRQGYLMEFKPILLKAVLQESSVSQAEFVDALICTLGRDISRPTVNLCINKGYIPPTIDGFKEAVEKTVGQIPKAVYWLSARQLGLADIWTPLGYDRRAQKPLGHGYRIHQARKRMAQNDPQIYPGLTQEVIEMISQEAMRHFKIFRNPFIDDIQKDADIYMSEEHQYIQDAMLDAARHGGFLAVIGEVGSGKSVMRRKVVEQLKRDDDVLVIFPQTIDKARLTSSSICDAIIQDVSSEKCLIKLEDKTRQVQRLLLARAKSGYRACLIIEEAHDLSINTLKYLKRFYELEDGYRKLLGIILIGQTELKHRFNESTNVDMREVIRRVQVAEIRGLDDKLQEYLSVKFKRVGKNVDEIFSEDAFKSMSHRLTAVSRDGREKISHAYPLMVNNYTARAMNLACEMGESKVTAEVIDAI